MNHSSISKSHCFPLIFGFSFIEVLMALFILSIGLLGLMELQIVSLKESQQNYYYSIAQVQLTAMLERLKANSKNYTRECNDWNQENQRLLPDGHGECRCISTHCDLVLQWDKAQNLHSSIIR